jgi:uncharacterized protein YnzC (UPF0291/DUF896 family)
LLSAKKLKRLNELARKAKTEGLSEAESQERQVLRQEYLENFRRGFRDQLDHIEVVDDDTESAKLN